MNSPSKALFLFVWFGFFVCLTFSLCVWFLFSGVGCTGLDTGDNIIKGCIITLWGKKYKIKRVIGF